MARRGGSRPRRYVTRDDVPVCVSGRWGPRRMRVEECAVVVRAEQVHPDPTAPGQACPWMAHVARRERNLRSRYTLPGAGAPQVSQTPCSVMVPGHV